MRYWPILFAMMMMVSVIPWFGTGTGAMEGPAMRSVTKDHDPIRIDGDSEFTSENGVISGSGTKSDPYVISGWDINGTMSENGINVVNTTKFFKVTGCRIHAVEDGMYFYNVHNSFIEGNTFERSNGSGIRFSYCENDRIMNNEIGESNREGILFVDENKKNEIVENRISECMGSGIYFQGQGNNDTLIERNQVRECGSGFKAYDCLNIAVKNNTFEHNRLRGAFFNDTWQGLICGNVFSDNVGEGIEWEGNSSKNIIFNNYIDRNGRNGIYTTGIDTLYFNSISDNAGSGIFSSSGHMPDLYKNIIRGNGRFDMESPDRGINIIDINYTESYPCYVMVDPNVTLPVRSLPLAGVNNYSLETLHNVLFYYSPFEHGITKKLHGHGGGGQNIRWDNVIDMENSIFFHFRLAYCYLWGKNLSLPSELEFTVRFEDGISIDWNITIIHVLTNVPNDDGANGTIPNGGNGTGTNETDKQNGNRTDVRNNTWIWNEKNNSAPSSASIGISEMNLSEGREFELSATSFDQDITHGDVLRYEWYIDGIGLVGIGETIQLKLGTGIYTIRLRVLDLYNRSIVVTKEIYVSSNDVGSRLPSPLFIIIASVIVLFVMAMGLIAIKRRSIGKDRPMEGQPPPSLLIERVPDGPSRKDAPFKAPALEGDIPAEDAVIRGVIGRDRIDMGVDVDVAISDLNRAPFDGVRKGRNHRKRELRKLIYSREDALDQETYEAIVSIIGEE